MQEESSNTVGMDFGETFTESVVAGGRGLTTTGVIGEVTPSGHEQIELATLRAELLTLRQRIVELERQLAQV